MCGIAGLMQSSSGTIERAKMRNVLRGLEHRGPDDAGILYYKKGQASLYRRETLPDEDFEVMLLHQRLSILDLSEAGWQPMGTSDRKFFLVFNGEIYNYLELRDELKALGYEFYSDSDTEVLLLAYRAWGAEVLTRLVGMFAFALLDVQKRKLFLARDLFGIKPLDYTWLQNGFAFASEIPPLLELSGAGRRVNAQRLYEYLRFGITDHGSETLFLDIKQLPSAHYLEVFLDNPQRSQCTRFWKINLHQQADISFKEAADRLRTHFVNNVALHLRSDVPVGAALSGGIDSSSIVMAMRHLHQGLDIHAFSYVADNTLISEERWIDIVGNHGKLLVHKVKSNPEELVNDLDALVYLQGEPFGSTSIYAQRQIFQHAREKGIKVMLDGQGADEIFGGYTFFIAARFGSLVRQGKWVDAYRLLQSASSLPGMNKWSLMFRAMDFVMPTKLQEPLRRCINKDLMPSWLNAQWFRSREVMPKSFGYTGGKEVLKECLFDNLIESSLPHLLRYEDRNSMAYSIESRVPFITPDLVDFMFSLPEEYAVSQEGTTKALFREAMRGIVPNQILDRKDKIGFATPEKDWLLNQKGWVSEVLASETASLIPAFNVVEVLKRWEGILQGGTWSDSQVWRWINIILWVKKFNVRVE